MKVLVTGAAGFVARHLFEFLQAEVPEAEISGVVRPGGRRPEPEGTAVRVLEADLEDARAVDALFDSVRPDRIVHLAAQSSVHRSWEDPAATLRVNVHGLLHLLEAVRKRGLTPRTLVVGSAEEYGMVEEEDLPVREDAPLRPASPYAVSKVAQGFLALQYVLSHEMPIVRTRTFHHTGPGRGVDFAESSFARQLADIEAGTQPPVLSVGNLEAVRDFTDVRDVVRAYWLLLERGQPGEAYNVCSGRGVRIGDVLRELTSLAERPVEVRLDPARLRPSDVPAMIGDPGKLQAATGWQPKTPLRETLRGLLDHWRERSRVAAPSEGRGR